jgi:alcohol dehydrogenase
MHRWEKDIDINQVTEIRTMTINYLGVGAINKINDIAASLKNRGISKIIVVTGKGAYKLTGAWDYVVKALAQNSIGYSLYTGVTPNPTVQQVDEATRQALDFGATAVISIGGGSPIDAAKGVAILMEYPNKTARDLFGYQFTPEKAVPLVTINLTHGTGTEVDRFAVVSIPEKEFKPVTAYDFSYPLYSIDDPALMTSLSADQTLYVTIDAMNHVIEACTTKVTSPYSIMMAHETIRLIAKYLPVVKANPQDLTARYFLTYASMIAGICFDNALLHFTHALEHPISGVKPEVSHGNGLAQILPAVIRQVYPAKCRTLADVLEPIVPGLKGVPEETEKACQGVKQWLSDMGIVMGLANLGFKKEDVDKLTKLAFETPSLGLLLSLAPVEATEDVVRKIYSDSY